MIKNYQQFVNEDLRSKKITLEPQCDNLKILYPSIKVNYNDDLKNVINYSESLKLNDDFYKALEKDNIKIEDIIFDDCKEILLYENKKFTKISDYGKFGEGIKDFNCSFCNNLQSLEGSPEKVGGYFSCSNCDKLTSLEGAPEKVDGYFNCSRCNLDFIKLAKQKYGDKVKS